MNPLTHAAASGESQTRADAHPRRPLVATLATAAALSLAAASLAPAAVHAAAGTDSPVLQELDEAQDPNARGADGSTPLQWAVYEGDIDRVRRLIEAGADVNAHNWFGSNPMQLAAEVADVDALRLLLAAGADADSPNPEGQTALMLVARTGNVEAARLLVEHGATVDAREQWGEQTALMWASARRHPKMVRFLLEQGADPDARSIVRNYQRHLTAEGRAKNLDKGGLTPLLFAARENCLACVEVLIEGGADLDLPDPDGVSPLQLAILNTNWDIAAHLIEAGACVDQWDIYGAAPLYVAVDRRNQNDVTTIDRPNRTDGTAVVRMLLERGANPNMQLFFRPAKQRGAPRSRGTTPLIQAAANGDTDMIRLLLEHGADVHLHQADRQSVVSALMLSRARESDVLEALEVLHEAGADMNVLALPHHIQRTRGGTPLHYAVRAGRPQVVERLVEYGADINAVDKDGLTALDYAMARGYVPFLSMRADPRHDLADLLRSLGATRELAVTPHWPPVGPPLGYAATIWPLESDHDPQDAS